MLRRIFVVVDLICENNSNKLCDPAESDQHAESSHFWVRRPAIQRLSLMWLISLSTTVLIFIGIIHFSMRGSFRDKNEDRFSG